MSEAKALPEPVMPLALAVDYYVRYPGEQVCLFARFSVPDQPGMVLQLSLPHVLEVESTELSGEVPALAVSLIEAPQELKLVLPLDTRFQAGREYEMKVKTRIHTFYFDQYLMLEAQLFNADGQVVSSESTQVAVRGQANYLRYLPELYESDDFINRFLMLFESFWKPIKLQIDQSENYYDPGLTPESFIPWLSSWIGLPVDSTLPVERLRALLRYAMMFYQCRGTYHALKTYLEIYTGGEVTVTERRARNFVLGPGSALGVETALGSANQPNSISILICVSQQELERTHFSEDMYRRKMIEIVRLMVPAHAVFDVRCEFSANYQIEEAQRIGI